MTQIDFSFTSTIWKIPKNVYCLTNAHAQGFKSVDHPLGMLVNTLTKCFVESYSGIAVHANLLPHSISELCSITTRLHHLVRYAGLTRICTKNGWNASCRGEAFYLKPSIMGEIRDGQVVRGAREYLQWHFNLDWTIKVVRDEYTIRVAC